MEILLAFFIGYAVGAKAGSESFSEVLAAAREVRQTDEFAGLVDALRSHLVSTLHLLADALSKKPEPASDDGLVERVLTIINSSRPADE